MKSLSRDEMKKVMGGLASTDDYLSLDDGDGDKCAKSACGSTGLPCCDPRDWCSNASSTGVCTSRP